MARVAGKRICTVRESRIRSDSVQPARLLKAEAHRLPQRRRLHRLDVWRQAQHLLRRVLQGAPELVVLDPAQRSRLRWLASGQS